MKVMVAQINPTIGDIQGNCRLIEDRILFGCQQKCDVVVLPELAIVGYPPRDLLYSPQIWKENVRAVERLLAFVKAQDHSITVIVGGLHSETIAEGVPDFVSSGDSLTASWPTKRYNAAWVLDKHYGKRVVHKRLLPCYDVFDETRYFTSESRNYRPTPIRLSDGTASFCHILICEDIWRSRVNGQTWMPAEYEDDPVEELASWALKESGSSSSSPLYPVFVVNASPFWTGKINETEYLVHEIAHAIRQPVVWCNQVGAHDDIITGGYSLIAIPESDGGTAMYRANAFQEDTLIVGLDSPSHPNANEPLPMRVAGQKIDKHDSEMWIIYRALCLHMADYKRRCGFERAVIALSGGIDSAVVAVLAAEVFGSENVTALLMPSEFSSEGSVIDAQQLAENLKIRFHIRPIDKIHQEVRDAFLTGGKQNFTNPVTDENFQPRIRALLAMGYSNDAGACLLLTTGNKSELSVGYCTLYGDMCGGLAVISDLWKTQVYQLAEFLNRYLASPIPQATLTKPASAELKKDQADTDTLPTYDVLDPLLQLFMEEVPMNECIAAMAKVLPPAECIRLHKMYRGAEFKRQQMPLGPKIQQRSFGSGRRMPIAMKLTSIL